MILRKPKRREGTLIVLYRVREKKKIHVPVDLYCTDPPCSRFNYILPGIIQQKRDGGGFPSGLTSSVSTLRVESCHSDIVCIIGSRILNSEGFSREHLVLLELFDKSLLHIPVSLHTRRLLHWIDSFQSSISGDWEAS